MRIWLHKIEKLIDRLIPLLLAVLLVAIVGELFFSSKFEWYRYYADWLDAFILLVFAADLGFKYARLRKFPTFLRRYWLEIIATIPFFLVFRLLELFRITDFFEKGQAIAHEALAAEKVEKEAVVLVKEAARAGEASRTTKMLSVFRALGRSPRMLRALHFFELPTGRHHWYERRKG